MRVLTRLPRSMAGVAVVMLATVLGPIVLAPGRAHAIGCGQLGSYTVTTEPWALQRLRPASVWPITRGGGVIVAVIDSGVSDEAAVLRGRLATEVAKDFTVSRGGSPHCDWVGHGTIVGAIIAGRDGRGLFTGIAPDATIMSLRILSDRNTSQENLTPRVAAAIRYAVDHRAGVINLSITTPPSPELESAVEYALGKNVVVVAAAGNEAAGTQEGPAYPAAYPGVIAVAGVNEQGDRVQTSISGAYVDVAAPGADIVGPAPTGPGYVFEQQGGTSYAAAYVSGVAALLRAYDPTMDVNEITERILLTADRSPEGYTDDLGYGVVNPYRAVTALLARRGNLPPPTVAPLREITDPLAAQKTIALWAALGGLVLSVSLLLGGRVIRAGRRRGWEPGTAD